MPDELPTAFDLEGFRIRIDLVELRNGRWNWELWIGDLAKVSPGDARGCASRNAALFEATAEAEWRVKGLVASD